jgi:acyl-CoA dehydrogenase-like protein
MVVRSEQVLPSPTAIEAANALDELLRRRVPPEVIGDSFFARDWAPLWTELGAAGWTLLADGPSPGTDGDVSLRDLAAVAETWGFHLVPLPLLETIIGRRWSSGRPPAPAPVTYALRVGSSLLLPFGEVCDEIVTGAAMGVGRVSRPSLGPASGLDTFAASLPMSIVSGGRDLPFPMRAEVAALNAATAVGAAAAALSASIEYAKLRNQFGRPIGSFQAVKHRLADMHCRVELARSAVAWACSDRTSAGEAAKHATGLCLRVAEDAVQVHGGIGYTWEAPVHRYLRQVMSVRRLVVAAATSP